MSGTLCAKVLGMTLRQRRPPDRMEPSSISIVLHQIDRLAEQENPHPPSAKVFACRNAKAALVGSSDPQVLLIRTFIGGLPHTFPRSPERSAAPTPAPSACGGGIDRIFVAAFLDETENCLQQPGKPGNIRQGREASHGIPARGATARSLRLPGPLPVLDRRGPRQRHLRLGPGLAFRQGHDRRRRRHGAHVAIVPTSPATSCRATDRAAVYLDDSANDAQQAALLGV